MASFDRNRQDYLDVRQKAVARYDKSPLGKESKRKRNRAYRATHKPEQDHTRKFFAWDGEGTGLKKEHRYILLMNSYIDENGNPSMMVNPNGLSTEECLNYLCETSKQLPGYTHIIFSGGYDFNMMFKDIPKVALQRLHKTGRLYWRNFRIEWHPKKSVTIGRYKPETFIHKKRRHPEALIEIWDVFGFFQGSFISALDTFFNKEEKKALHYDEIKAGKDKRATFTMQELEDFITPYTRLEVAALVALMDRLYNEYCLQAGVVLKRFDGSGAIAKAVMMKNGVKKHYPGTNMLPQVEVASQYGYGGARIEIIKYGSIGVVTRLPCIVLYNYDVISCYPSITVNLPELATGDWWYHREGQINHENPFSIYRVEWDFRPYPAKPFYPFFYRSWPNGSVTFPAFGENWIWYPELAAYFEYQDDMPGNVRIREQYEYTPGSNVKPFGFVQQLFDRRKKLKAEGNGMQQVDKLAINSIYGSVVQHLGYEEHKMRGEKKWRPPYYCLQYGGYITSGARALLYRAGMQNPTAIVGFATDGIWSTEPLNLDIGENLGQWEVKYIQKATFVQSGVYWTTGLDGKTTHHYRGFDRENLKEEDIRKAWELGLSEWPVKSTRFVTLGQGLMLNDFGLWHTWNTTERNLDLHPTNLKNKRQPVPGSIQHPAYELVDTYPNNMKVGINKRGKAIISEKYPLPWTEERTTYDDNRKKQILDDDIRDSIEERYD